VLRVQLKIDEIMKSTQLRPLATLLYETLDRLQKKDTNRFFAFPVSVNEVTSFDLFTCFVLYILVSYLFVFN